MALSDENQKLLITSILLNLKVTQKKLEVLWLKNSPDTLRKFNDAGLSRVVGLPPDVKLGSPESWKHILSYTIENLKCGFVDGLNTAELLKVPVDLANDTCGLLRNQGKDGANVISVKSTIYDFLGKPQPVDESREDGTMLIKDLCQALLPGIDFLVKKEELMKKMILSHDLVVAARKNDQELWKKVRRNVLSKD